MISESASTTPHKGQRVEARHKPDDQARAGSSDDEKASWAFLLCVPLSCPASAQTPVPNGVKPALAQRIGHTDPARFRHSEAVHQGGIDGFRAAAWRGRARHQFHLPASRNDPAEERDRPAFPQSMRGDVRHPRRRGRIHHRRAHLAAKGAGRRAGSHGPRARHLQSHRQARSVAERQCRLDQALRRLQPWRSARRRGEGSHSPVHHHEAGPRAAEAGQRHGGRRGHCAISPHAGADGVLNAVVLCRPPAHSAGRFHRPGDEAGDERGLFM